MADIQDPRNIGITGLRGFRPLGAVTENTPDSSTLFGARDINTQNALTAPAIEDVGISGAGDSKFERGKWINPDNLANLQEYRGQAQTAFGQALNGTLKGGVLAGTTFLQGTIGLLTGIGSAISGGSFWNNDFNRALKAVNDWTEKVLPNYYTDDQRENPFAFRNIISANTIFDKFVKNLGFTVGAFYAGGMFTKPLQAINAIKNSVALGNIASGLGATLSAFNEGSIEAINNSTDWYNLQKAQLDDEYARQWEDLQFYQGTSNYEEMLGNLQTNYQNKLSRLKDDATKMGNTDLLLNLPILLASNIVQFGKLYARGFDEAKRAGRIAIDRAARTATSEMGGLGLAGAIASRGLAEGFEEVTQQLASNYAGIRREPKDFHLSMTEAQIDPDTEETVTKFMKDMGTALHKTVVEDWQDTLEQFLIGGLTGMLGMPTFGKANNVQSWLGKNKIIGLSGGAVDAYREYKEKQQYTEGLANELTKRMQDPNFLPYYQGMLRHETWQNAMNKAAQEDNAKEYKDAEYGQMISDIGMFYEAGKIDDLVAMIDEATDTSDENLKSIEKNTTREDGTGPFIDDQGNPESATAEGKQKEIEAIQSRAEEMHKAIDAYRKTYSGLSRNYGQAFSRRQLAELTWYSMFAKDQYKRAIDITKTSGRDAIKGVIASLKEEMAKLSEGLETWDEYNDMPVQHNATFDRIQRLDTNVKQFERLLALDDASLAATLADKANKKHLDFVVLKTLENAVKGLDANDESTVTENQKKARELQDLPSLIEGSEKFLNKFNEFIQNPEKLQKQEEQQTKNAVKRAEEKKVAQQATNFNNAKTFREIRDAIVNSQLADDVVEKALENSVNPVAKDFKVLRNRVNAIRNNLEAVTKKKEVREDAERLLDVLMSRAEKSEDFDLTSEIFIDPTLLPDREGETPAQKKNRLKSAKQAIIRALQESNRKQAGSPNTEDVMDTEDGQVVLGEDVEVTVDEGTGSSEVGTVPPVNTEQGQQNVSDTNTLIEGETENGDISVRVNEEYMESPSGAVDTSKGRIEKENEEEALPEIQIKEAQSLWRPAVSQYDLTAMKDGRFVAKPNAEWQRVNAHLQEGFKFTNNGQLAEYAKNGGRIYFGIDPSFDENLVLMYTKVEDRYIPIGSMFVGKDKIKQFVGMESFINELKDAYNKQENKSNLFIFNKTAAIKLENIKRGRAAYSTLKPVSKALQGSDINTPNFVVVTRGGLVGASSKNVVKPENLSDKEGNVYIEVPNAKRGNRGGISLMSVTPVVFNKDLLDKDNSITRQIKSALELIANGAIQNDRAKFTEGLKALSRNLLIQNLDFGLTKSGQLRIGVFTRDSEGNLITYSRKGKVYNRTNNVIEPFSSNNIQETIDKIVEALIKTGVRIRINKSDLSPEYTKTLIDNDLVQTYYDNFNVQASWFEIDPSTIEDTSAEKPQETKVEETPATPITPEPQTPVADDSLLDDITKGLFDLPGEAAPIEPVAQKPEQKEKIVPQTFTTSGRNGQPVNMNRFTDEQKKFLREHIKEFNFFEATDEEIDNYLACKM